MVNEERWVYFSGTTFYQQRLSAWRPDFTSAGTTIPTIIVIGLAFIGIGLVVRRTTNGVITMHFLLIDDEQIIHVNWFSALAISKVTLNHDDVCANISRTKMHTLVIAKHF